MFCFRYLFWVINGSSSENGLYRLDLGNVSNGVKHDVLPSLILNSTSIGAFAIDYVSLKILVPLQKDNKVISVDLDGKNDDEIRNANNTQNLMTQNVKSIAMANQMFYWTDGKQMINEEFHSTEKKYYNNKFPFKYPTLLFVRINVSSAQPVPTPVNPPTNLQALLNVRHGKVSWHIPHLLGKQGKGAWQEWHYELEITNEDDNSVNTIGGQMDIRGTHYPVDHLQPNTNYKFRVAAYTSAGRGLWSTEFRCKTLKSSHDRYLIWSTNDGLLQSDVLGEHIFELVPKSRLGNQNITDIAWFEDKVYFISNNRLHEYNRTSVVHKFVDSLHTIQIQSIAIDWIAKRLYWFTPDNQVISRAPFDVQEHEPLVTVSARDVELEIDPIRGFLYFSTLHTVEYCRLNGRNKREYYHDHVYSGKQVMGLTLDIDNLRVYWIVRSYDGSSLLSAPMATDDWDIDHSVRVEEYTLKDKTLQGPLTYFSDRLLWLQGDQTVIIGNMTGKNLAHIRNAKLTGLKTFAVIDPTHRIYPDGIQPLTVIPESINVTSIQILGTAESFNVSWSPITTVTYGQVFYDIRFLGTANTETTSTTVHYANETLPPYSPINISIQAYTYWGKSKLANVYMHTPPAKPSAPTTPHVFIAHLHNPIGSGRTTKATFRWSMPIHSNGPIQGYKLYCWYEEEGIHNDVYDGHMEAPNIFEKIIPNLVQNVTYFFRVQAYSSVGDGEITETISINSNVDSPVPLVLAAVKSKEIWLIDLDLQEKQVIANTDAAVRYMTYIAHEHRYFWVTDSNDLISLTNDTKVKLATLGTAQILSLTVDWIERILYWSQVHSSGSAIYLLDLNKFESEAARPKLQQIRTGIIWSLVISPLHRTLYWVETQTNSSELGHLYTQNLNTEELADLFLRNDGLVRRELIINTSSQMETLLFWWNEDNQLFSTDTIKKTTKPISLRHFDQMQHVVMDSARMYWYSNDAIQTQSQNDAHLQYDIPDSKLLSMLAFNHQTYPLRKCLIPLQRSGYIPSLIEAKERSLVLRLPVPEVRAGCTNKLAGIKYTILYKRLNDSIETANTPKKCSIDDCKVITVFQDVTEIPALNPYVRYKFQVGINNYYGEKLGTTTTFGPVVILSTAIGSPTVPRNITAEAISPTEVHVQWLPPVELNSDRVWYEVHWQTQYDINGVKNQQFMPGICSNLFCLYLSSKHFFYIFQSAIIAIWIKILLQ